MDLDNPSRYCDLDRDGMLGHIDGFVGQCAAAWKLAQSLVLPKAYRSARHVVVLGMGGSAIGGALLQGLVSEECAIPITIVRGYSLPAFVRGSDYLVMACSYSGDTEETLLATHEALCREVHVVAVTTGGQLAELAQDNGFPLVRFGYRSQPRAALPYIFLLLPGVLMQLGLLRDLSDELTEALQVMRDWQAEIGPEIPTGGNGAKSMARRFETRLPVIYGAGCLIPVANRWKTQLNENAKHWAAFETMPELNHNAVVGYRYSQATREQACVVMLRSNYDHPRVQARWDVTQELLVREGVANEVVYGRGRGRLAQVLSLILFGDYVSYYLAMLNEVDPTPVDAIVFLKRRIAEVA